MRICRGLRFLVPAIACMTTACESDGATQDSASAPDSPRAVVAAPDSAAAVATLLADIRNRVEMMNGMNATYIAEMFPAHHQAVSNVLNRMAAEEGARGLRPSARRRALADSVRSDLRRMAEMRPAKLELEMRPHGARLLRLIELHRLDVLER